MICLSCNNQEFTVKQDAVIEQEFRGETLRVRTPAMACTQCGWTAVAFEQLDEMRRRTADVYREKHGRLTSSQIKDYRNRLKMSQTEFAVFLDVGIASVKRWETWQVQDPIYDARIREKCNKAIEQLQSHAHDLWICAAHHGTAQAQAPHGVEIHATSPKLIMSSRWDLPAPGPKGPAQLTHQAISGLSPPASDQDACSLSAPTPKCRKPWALKKDMRMPIVQNTNTPYSWITCQQP